MMLNRRTLWIVTGLYVLVFAALTLARWNAWNYGRDLGIFAQAVWNTPHGFTNMSEGGTHFRFHFSPILAAFWPLLLAWKSPLALQFAQLLMTAATAPLVYAIFRRHTDERTSVSIALFCLWNPYLYPQAFNEFHELAPFLPLAFALVWALDRERWGLAALFTLLCCCVREDAALVCAILLAGLAAALRQARGDTAALRQAQGDTVGLLVFTASNVRVARMMCVGLAMLCVAVMGMYFGAIVPRLGGWHPSEFYSYPFAQGPLAVMFALLVQPRVSWPAFFEPGRLTYALELVAATAALPFRSRWVLFALPGLAVVLLANSGGVWRIGAHYVILWLPFVSVAFGLGALSLAPIARKRWFVACATIVVLITVVGNPLHLGTYLKPSYHDRASAARTLDALGDVPLSTHDEWQTRYSLRDLHASSVVDRSSRYFVYADDYPDARVQREILPELRDAVTRGALRESGATGSVRVYQRVVQGWP